MESSLLKKLLEAILPEISFSGNGRYPEVIVPAEKLHSFCENLRSSLELQFDYLISLTAVDWKDHFMLVSHITSSTYGNTIVVKCRIDDREKPEVDTLSDIWKTAEFHEREVFDLFGIRFRNHPDMRRLFLEDEFGYPLRKDFTDESRMIIK